MVEFVANLSSTFTHGQEKSNWGFHNLLIQILFTNCVILLDELMGINDHKRWQAVFHHFHRFYTSAGISWFKKKKKEVFST